MKKLINAVDDVLTESLDGFAAAHADIVDARRRPQVRPPQDAEARQGRADLGRRLRPRAAAWRVRRSRHARCRLPRPGLHLADARPDDGGGRGGRTPAPACLFIVKNYEGDVMNFDMAAEMSEGVDAGGHQ